MAEGKFAMNLSCVRKNPHQRERKFTYKYRLKLQSENIGQNIFISVKFSNASQPRTKETRRIFLVFISQFSEYLKEYTQSSLTILMFSRAEKQIFPGLFVFMSGKKIIAKQFQRSAQDCLKLS